jgi:hypothetical protein
MYHDFSDIKVGDKVIMVFRNGRSVKVVQRVTNTMVVVHKGTTLDGKPIDKRFNRKTGLGVNDDPFYYSHLEEWSQEEENTIRATIVKRKLVEKISKFPFASLNVSDLEKIEQVINEFLVDIKVNDSMPKVSENIGDITKQD